MPVPAITAEWNCTRCGTTNRLLVAADTSAARDRCLHCGATHRLRAGARPVRWDAEPDEG
ncbi:MAG: hypothetical protein NW201_02440 [Gemmatimonadales bacterium]|nr:hypothetical protein [Gemmatimonadales bacterium]